MVIRIEFNTASEEHDESELQQVLHARDVWLAIWALDQEMRSDLKYSDKELKDTEHWRERLHEILGDHGCSIDAMVT